MHRLLKSRSNTSSTSTTRRLSLLRTRDVWTLASSHRWADLHAELSTDRGARQARDESDPTGHSLLHTVVAFDPPVDVVRSLIRLNPVALADGGTTGTLPIHVAVAYGASVDVVRTLLTESTLRASDGTHADETELLAATDAFGRTALHIAVQRACDDLEEKDDHQDNCRNRRRDKKPSARWSESLAVLSYLWRRSPELIGEADDSGETPLDAALFQGRGGRKGPVASVLLQEMKNSTRRASVSGVEIERRRRRESVQSVSTCGSTEEEVRRRSSLGCCGATAAATTRDGGGSSNNWHDMNQLKELIEWTRTQSRYRSMNSSSLRDGLGGPNVSRPPAA